MACMVPGVGAVPTESSTAKELKSAWLRAEPVEFGDPVLARVYLPHQGTYYPLGFQVQIVSNSEYVLACASESWGGFTPLFDRQPLMISVVVTESESERLPPTPVCRMRDHLLTSIADQENFVVVDLDRGTAFVSVTTAALRDREYFRYFFLEASAMGLIANRYATGIHAACVEWNGTGILLCGDSGAGKSTLAYACARAGWTYVTDDGSYLVHNRTDRLVVGNCRQARFRPEAQKLFPELGGRPVMSRAGVGKPSVELSTPSEPAMSIVPVSRVQRIVFLNRREPRQDLEIFPTAVARLYFTQQIYSMPFSAPQHLESVDNLLRLGAWELRYRDLDWAVERLQLLATEGR